MDLRGADTVLEIGNKNGADVSPAIDKESGADIRHVRGRSLGATLPLMFTFDLKRALFTLRLLNEWNGLPVRDHGWTWKKTGPNSARLRRRDGGLIGSEALEHLVRFPDGTALYLSSLNQLSDSTLRYPAYILVHPQIR